MFRIKNLSEDFVNKIVELSAGKVQQNILEIFLSHLEKEISRQYFTRASESNLIRIIQHQIDIVFFINECIKYPYEIEILVNIANNSNYLSDILVRNPEYFFWVNTPSTINKDINEKYYSQVLEDSLQKFKSFSAKVNVIRNFKRKEILRLGLKDIYLKEELSLITEYLSVLAKSIIKALFKICYDEILIKHGIEKTSNRYVLLALGKLGGNELNYSSDVDLIAFYDKNTLKGKKFFYNQILTETILLFIETAGEKTGAGFLYRVDFRLRPDGRNAPLCGSLNDYLRYYEMRGEAWERQMLIKAGFVCGSERLFKKFMKEISTFIYPVTFFVSPSEQIKKLKSSIEGKIFDEINIKLSSGGIRDIEFSLQTLQLINGGKEADIRTGNSLKAIKLLEQKNLLTENEARIFSEAYILYRKVEHYLQLMNDQQTHTLPTEGEITEKIAFYLGFQNIKSFKEKIEFYRLQVRNIFNSIVEIKKYNIKTTSIEKISFADKKRAENNIEFLRTGKSILNKKSFDNRTVNAFENIEGKLYDFLSNSVDPDLVLENFARVIRTANFPKIWFDEFKDEKFFNLFLTLCEQSQKTINLFAEDKSLREEFLSRESLKHFNAIDSQLLSLKTFLFRTSLQITSGILTATEFPYLYSDYLSEKIIEIINEFSVDKSWQDDFFVGALGSFGLKQLHFASDIDLIFIIKDLNNKLNLKKDVQKDFQTLLQTLRHKFPNLEIDCRLRPEGKSSQLVWDLKSYENYLFNRARIWELQSLTKCRFIVGNRILYDEFYNSFTNTAKQKSPLLIKNEMSEMRKKLIPINSMSFDIKKSSGGLLDIDFIVENTLLSNTELMDKLKNENIQVRIKSLEKYISVDIDLHNLLKHYNFLKNLEISNQNIFDIKSAKIPTNEKKLSKLVRALKFKDNKSFLNYLNTVSENIRMNYLKVFGK